MKSRYNLLVFFLGLVSLVWVVYLFSVQVLDPLHLSASKFRRYIPSKEMLIPTRGAIYDYNGNMLVSSISFYQVDVDRGEINKWAERNKMTLDAAYQEVAKLFGKHTSLEESFVLGRLNLGKKLSSVQISNKIKESELDGLIRDFDARKINGLLHSFSFMRRIYSQDRLAARILGAVKEVTGDENNNSNSIYKLSGMCGIEASFDKELAGSYGWREIVKDANNERVPYPNLKEKKPVNGSNVWLTIDSRVQEIVEEALIHGLDAYGAKNAAAVVMDPNSGKILAMSGMSVDDRELDPNIVRSRPNIPISFMFEPGSTMKPLTMLPALELKLISSNERFPSGTYLVGRRRISDTHSYGLITPREIIAKSSNVGIAKIAERVGSKRLYEKLISLGFGQKTGLKMFGESSGILAKLDNWDGYSLHSISFGQAISVTAVQLANAYCTVANGGKLMKPYLVDSFRDDNGQIIEQFEPTVLQQVSTKTATDTLRSYLQSVVDEGTARNLKMSYITIGGKTGTAQKKLEGSSGYAGDKYTSVFVGFFPVEKPEVVICVLYDEPAGGLHYGSMSAAPTFKKIVENILFMPNCKILPFNERLMQNSLQMPDLKGQTIFRAEQILNQYGFLYKIEGPDSASVVIDQFPKPGVSVDRNHPITVKIGKTHGKQQAGINSGVMPDLKGLTLRKALQTAGQYKVNLVIDGSGKIRKQSILPGSRIVPGASCSVEATL